MVGKYQTEDQGEVLEVEKMLALDSGDSRPDEERRTVYEMYGAWEGVNGKAKEIDAAVVVEMEVYSVAYELMADGKEGHSVSKKSVEREVA